MAGLPARHERKSANDAGVEQTDGRDESGLHVSPRAEIEDALDRNRNAGIGQAQGRAEIGDEAVARQIERAKAVRASPAHGPAGKHKERRSPAASVRRKETFDPDALPRKLPRLGRILNARHVRLAMDLLESDAGGCGLGLAEPEDGQSRDARGQLKHPAPIDHDGPQ